MAKRPSASSARVKRAARSARHIPDSRIDFTDIPESTDKELKEARRVGRPRRGDAKLLIAIRIDRRLLSDLRDMAKRQDKPYQTLIHELLEKAAKRRNDMSEMTMVYWKGKKFWVGKLKEFPEIMTQGRTLKELEENIRDAYRMMVMEDVPEKHREKAIAV